VFIYAILKVVGDKFGHIPPLAGCPHLKYNTKQMKNATSIIHKAYKTSVVIPRVTLKKDFIFIL